MLPNESMNTKFNTSVTVSQSRAYTFLDSYIYMKNNKYNALYEKNKEILAIEKEGIEKASADILYFAATEQTKNLNSVIVRVRNFSQAIRNDVVNNLLQIIPDNDEISAFEEAISACANIPKQKVLKYKILPITYPNMAIFYGLFKKELREFAHIDDESASIKEPFIHNVATKYLIDTTEKYARINPGILENESMEITTIPELVRIKDYFRKKSMIITAVNRDFRVFYFYLRQYRSIQQIMTAIKPTVRNDGTVLIGTNDVLKSFSDYLVIYKHYSMMIKYLMDIISCYDSRFFNKIYAIQSNIEVYRSIMNDTVSVYRTRSRNMNESAMIETFDNLGFMISGQDNVKDFMNDNMESISIDSGDDSVDRVKVPESEIEYPEEVFDGDNYELDIEDFDTNSVCNSRDNGCGDKIYCKDPIGRSCYSDSANNCSRDLSIASISAKHGYELVDPRDLHSSKDVLKEAVEGNENLKKVLNNIVTAIHDANSKFKDSAKRIREENGNILEDAKNIDISTADLSGIEFDMFKYPKGVDLMNHIRIPMFRTDDADLLREDNGINYKQKYFKDLYYFSQKGCPLNINKFRGSQAKKTIDEPNLVNAFNWFIEYIDNYSKVISSIGAANTRIQNCVKMISSVEDKASGGTDERLVEAIILNRSIFRDKIYDILLESDNDLSMNDIKDAIPVEGDETKSVEPKDSTETQKEVEEKDSSKDKSFNIDDAAAEKANTYDNCADAMKVYFKIVYEVNSTKMDIYEEVYITAFRFLKIIVNSLGTAQTETDKLSE